MTDTDTTTTEPVDQATTDEAAAERARMREQPTDRFGFLGLSDPDEINARWKEVYAELEAATLARGEKWKPFGGNPDLTAASEDMRRAFVQCLPGRGAKSTTPRRVEIPQANIVEQSDGSLTITCVGVCGETKPIKKFPTNKQGGRDAECRDCRDKRVAENKAAIK